MSSRVFPSTGEKPKFNPNEPYEAVQDRAAPSQKKPKFNPNEPFEEAGGGSPAQKAFEIKISEPTFKGGVTYNTPHRTFTDQKPVDEYELTRLKNKAAKAEADRLADLKDLAAKAEVDLGAELRGNDAHYEKKVREIRRDAFTMEDLKKEAQQKKYIIPVGQEKEILRLAKERQYNLPVSPEDISDIKTGTIINSDFSRQFIKELNNPAAQKHAYYVDAYNHAANDIDGSSRADKIKENADKIGKREYVYDPVNRILGKPEGFIKSVLSGRDDLNKSFDLYNYIKEAPDASVIDRLNTELTGDVDEPVPVPEGKISGIGRMMGSQPLKGLVGGGVAAVGITFSGHPEHAATAFNVANAALSAVDMYKIGFANAVKANYALFKQQGLSDNEALQKAKVLGENQANMDAAGAALMSFAAGKLAFKPTSINLLKKPLVSALGQIGEDLAKKSIEGAGVGAIGGVTQILKNIQAKNEGLPVEATEGFKEQLEAGVMLTAATHIIAKSSSLVKPSTLNKLKKIVSTVPKEVVDQNINSQLEAGHITPEEAKAAQSEIDGTRTVNSMIRSDIPESDRDKIAAKIKERNELKKRLETEDELYHPEIKEKIKKLNEEALAINNGSERGDLQSFVIKEILDGNVDDLATDQLKMATEKELKQYMQDIANLARRNPETEQGLIKAYGKKIVSKAQELFPVNEDYNEIVRRVRLKGATEKFINAIPKDIKLRERFLADSEDLVGSIFGKSGYYDHSLNEIGVGKFYANILGKNYLTYHEAAHAATLGHFLDIIENPKDYTKEQISAVNDLISIMDKYINNTSKGAKFIHDKLYGTNDRAEFLAEFISNPGFREYVLKTSPDKKVNAINYIFRRIVEMFGAKKEEIPGLAERLQHGVDTILDLSAEYNNKSSKHKENAENVRGDEGQVPLTGDGSERSQEQSGGNIQLQEGAQPIPAETQQQTGNEKQGEATGEEVRTGMDGGIPPNMMDLPFIPELPDVTRLAHADTELIYDKLGMADRIPRATKDDIRLENEADQLIKSGYDFEGKADRIISGREKSFTDAEQVAFAKIVGALNVKLEGLDPNSPEFNSTLETIDRLSRASDIVGSESGAAFRARRMFVLNDETLSSFLQKAKEANLDVPLTEDQAAAVKAKYDDIKASRDAYRARLEKLADEYNKLKAEKNFKKAKSESGSNKKKSHNEYQKERDDIVAKMREKLKKSRGDTTVVVLPYAKELIAIAPEVGKLLKSLAAEGVDKLEDAIKRIHEYVKEVIPQVTENDIHNIIAGEYSKKQTKNDLQEKVYEMRLQAKLINRLEELKSGAQPRTKVAKLKRSAEIEELRKQIKELAGKGSEESKLASLKSRYKNQIDALQKKIDEGDFEPDERATLELDKEAIDLKDAYIKKKIEWQKAVAQDAFNNRSLKQKGKDLAIEILGIPRTVMSSMDLSAPLRQGLVLSTSHPFVASKAFVESLKQAADPARFDRWLYDLKESDFYKNVIEKSGLYVADPNNLHLSAKEEAYMSNLAEKIPIVGDTIKTKGGKTVVPGLGLISKSERAYVSYLNKLRVDVFTMYATGLAEKGITPETRPDVYEALGAFINAATGRGELGDLERSAPILNALFFSPRLIASRLNMLNPVWYASLPKEVRVMAIKDMAKMIGVGATTVGLLSLVKGITVEKDPRSADFGKVKVGNTRWDVWGGFQQYVRLASQLFSGYEKKANGNVVPLGPGRNQQTRADKFFSFFRGKLSPIPSMLVDFGTGKTAVGEDVTVTNEMKDHLIPMIGNDVAEAWKEQGPMSIVYTGVPSFFGVGTTTYKEKEQKSSGKGTHQKSKKNKKTKKDG